MRKFLILLIFIANNIYAQENNNWCNTTNIVNKEINKNQEYKDAIQEIIINSNEWTNNNKKSNQIITIPVVIHIIHRQQHSLGQGTNIPDYQILDALRILNEDYSKTNPEFPNPPRNIFVNSAGNPNLEFCLATIDPSGNATNGITRTVTSKVNFDPDTESNDMKRNQDGGKDGWDPSRYLNIWICDLASGNGGAVLGYAYLPGLPSWDAWKDGLVVDFQYFGTTGIAAPSSDGRTATHEIGHYLGLNHTFAEASGWGWSNPCVDSQGNLQCCDNDDSNVNDTPPTDGIYWGPVNSLLPFQSSADYNSCNDMNYGFSTDMPDMHENYMSYATDTWMFTNGQINVMNSTLNGYRSNLKNSTVSTNCTGTLSINDILLDDILVYPNPTNRKIKINTKYQIHSIFIQDIIGKNIYLTEKINNKEIDLISLEDGVYFLTINTHIGTISQKIILTK